jgi:hypothetical protein
MEKQLNEIWAQPNAIVNIRLKKLAALAPLG